MWFVYDEETKDLACIVPDSCAQTTYILDDLSRMGYTFTKVDSADYIPETEE